MRIDAAIALAELSPTHETIKALQRGVADDDYLVRYRSANTLLIYAGHDNTIDKHPLFEAIASPPNEADASPSHREAWADAGAALAAEALALLDSAAGHGAPPPPNRHIAR